jgi:hypothetical protein
MFGRKKKQAASLLNPWTALEIPVRVEGAMMLELLDVELAYPFDLREFARAMFTADFLSATHVLRAANVDAEAWWSEAMLDEQYDGGDRETREDALRVAMRFGNSLDDAEYDSAQILVAHATMRMKALALALACDHEYGTAYCKQIATDPLSFGVERFGS